MVRRIVVAVAIAAVLAAGCSTGKSHTASSPSTPATPLPADPHTAAALLKIARVFNNDYSSGHYAPVYARWDARSQAVISRAGYIRRHTECPSPPQPAPGTESVNPGPHETWIVHYEIGGQQLTDYWFYVHSHWEFDLVLSNPDSVKLYRMSPANYATAVGCAHG